MIDAVQVDEPVIHVTQTAPDTTTSMTCWIALRSNRRPGQRGQPLRFALYNLALRGGPGFDDRTVGRSICCGLRIDVPFLSNFSADREVKEVTPRLAFRLNGSAFDTAAQTTPFAQNRQIQGQPACRWLRSGPSAASAKPCAGAP